MNWEVQDKGETVAQCTNPGEAYEICLKRARTSDDVAVYYQGKLVFQGKESSNLLGLIVMMERARDHAESLRRAG